MANDLRSFQFRVEREAKWLELDALVKEIERGRGNRLDFDQISRLPHLYRAALSALSVARSISLDKGLVRYLDSLCARAYMAVYGNRLTFIEAVSQLFSQQIPRAIRQSASSIFHSAAFMCLGLVVGYWIVATSPDHYYAIIPEALSGGRTPDADISTLRASIYSAEQGGIDGLTAFASYLFAHNAMVGIFSFALGFAAMAPTLLLLFYNGLILGAMFRVFAMHNLGLDFFAWLSIHGTTELFAVVLCGAGGILIGKALVFPGRFSRIENLAIQGRQAGLLVIMAIVMLFAAGLIEGVARQTVQSTELRLIIGYGFLAFWIAYFTLAGRKR